jgi:FkbM family methyltransferase
MGRPRDTWVRLRVALKAHAPAAILPHATGGTALKLRYRIADALGYDLKRKRRNVHAVLERHVARLCAKLDVDCVIDVGANRGQYGRRLRAAGYPGPIVSFEPVPEVASELARTIRADSAWAVHGCALGCEEGERVLVERKNPQLSSFLESSDFGTRALGAELEAARRRSVRVTRLDRLDDPWLRKAQRLFLKMDTQGFDLEVLRGAAGCLERVCGLQSELSVTPLYEGVPDYLESIGAYRRLGFEVTGFFPVFRERSTLVIGEFDCVLARVPGSAAAFPRIELT